MREQIQRRRRKGEEQVEARQQRGQQASEDEIRTVNHCPLPGPERDARLVELAGQSTRRRDSLRLNPRTTRSCGRSHSSPRCLRIVLRLRRRGPPAMTPPGADGRRAPVGGSWCRWPDSEGRMAARAMNITARTRRGTTACRSAGRIGYGIGPYAGADAVERTRPPPR